MRMGEKKAPRGHHGAFFSPVRAGALRAPRGARLPTVAPIIRIIPRIPQNIPLALQAYFQAPKHSSLPSLADGVVLCSKGMLRPLI